MTAKEVYKIWAPQEARWTDWVRPVLFIDLDKQTRDQSYHNFMLPETEYVTELAADVAYILDLPEYESVTEGLALARLGYRPIPLYNGTSPQNGVMAIVDNQSICDSLLWGAGILKTMAIAIDAPPVFLLDSNRLHRHKINVSIFDNSWDIYEQDIPSAEYFRLNGISKIVVRAEKLNRDLARILYKFQQQGLLILLTDGQEKPARIRIRKPPRKDKFH